MRHLMSLSLACVFGSLIAVAGQAATLHVPAQYPTIVAAVAAAHSGDSIHVDEGIYTDVDPDQTNHPGVAIWIDKPNLEIVGEEGAILDGSALTAQGNFTNGFQVVSTGVTIRGFTVRGFTFGITAQTGGGRIQANTVTDCGTGILCLTGTNVNTDPPLPVPPRTTIDHNSVTLSGTGIQIDGSQNVVVTHNTVSRNGTDTVDAFNFGAGPGIEVIDGSVGCTVDHNTVYGNTQDGILLSGVQTITVTQNTVDGNTLTGIDMDADTGCTVDHNEVDRNGIGIDLHDLTSNCKVDHNEASGNAQDGILIETLFFGSDPNPYPCTGNVMTNNTALGNGVLDAQDQSAPNNTWSHNKFLHTLGI